MPASRIQAKVQLEAYRLLGLQFVGIVILSLVAGLLYGWKYTYSVFAGGLAYWLPNVIFVWRVFRYAGAQQMLKFVAAFYFGEMIKLILSAFLFLIIVKYLSVSLLSVLVGFVGAIVSFWIGCIWYFSKQEMAKKRVAQ